MKRIVTGIVAHVDAGKTTLSEALLYATGQTRKLGRVDHGDSFLDTDELERARGITIFTEPAVINTSDTQITLLDTPGHVDFSAETERTLQVLDYAILVVSAADGIQGHTQTLWRLLKQYQVPTFIFVNKMDMPDASRARMLAQLQERFADSCVDFTETSDSFTDEQTVETIALQSEDAMNQFLENGVVDLTTTRQLISQRLMFPVYFGSALKMEGIREFITGFEKFTVEPEYPKKFGARVFKISHDTQGNRLTWLKVCGGELRAKMLLGEGDDAEKVDQVRVYSGAKSSTVEAVPAGSVCAVTGPQLTFPGEGLGCAQDSAAPILQPVLTYTLLPGECDIHKCLLALRELEDEDPLLHVVWQERLQEVHVQLMGAVQLEIIESLMRSRFNLNISFGQGSILYKETITAPVEGVGHFEPLRHYAEVHVLLEPLPRGAGMEFASTVSVDELDRNWQRLILQHCKEREHLGVLIGAPLTDVRITLIAGRGHLKHTEGGDFRQATYRAIRMGLMESRAGVPTSATPLEVAERFAQSADSASESSVRASSSSRDDSNGSAGEGSAEGARIRGVGNCRLLEPWYRFRLELPQEMIGRAMSDVQRMSGVCESQTTDGTYAVIEGVAPVSEMRDYAMDVNAYSHGEGRISLVFDGYRDCHNTDEVLSSAEYANYDPEADLDNTPDSVFCAHGAGYPVKWYKVPEFCHIPMR